MRWQTGRSSVQNGLTHGGAGGVADSFMKPENVADIRYVNFGLERSGIWIVVVGGVVVLVWGEMNLRGGCIDEGLNVNMPKLG